MLLLLLAAADDARWQLLPLLLTLFRVAFTRIFLPLFLLFHLLLLPLPRPLPRLLHHTPGTQAPAAAPCCRDLHSQASCRTSLVCLLRIRAQQGFFKLPQQLSHRCAGPAASCAADLTA